MGRPQAAHLGANTLWGEAERSRLSPPPARHPSHEPLYEDGPGTFLGLLLWAFPSGNKRTWPPHSTWDGDCLFSPLMVPGEASGKLGVWRPALNRCLLKSGKAGATELGRLLQRPSQESDYRFFWSCFPSKHNSLASSCPIGIHRSRDAVCTPPNHCTLAAPWRAAQTACRLASSGPTLQSVGLQPAWPARAALPTPSLLTCGNPGHSRSCSPSPQ